MNLKENYNRLFKDTKRNLLNENVMNEAQKYVTIQDLIKTVEKLLSDLKTLDKNGVVSVSYGDDYVTGPVTTVDLSIEEAMEDEQDEGIDYVFNIYQM